MLKGFQPQALTSEGHRGAGQAKASITRVDEPHTNVRQGSTDQKAAPLVVVAFSHKAQEDQGRVAPRTRVN